MDIISETKQAFDIVRQFGDRGVKNGGVFNDLNEVLSFVSAYNNILKTIEEFHSKDED